MDFSFALPWSCVSLLLKVSEVFCLLGDIFPLFQSYSKSVTMCFTVHISREWQGGGGWGAFCWMFLYGWKSRGAVRWALATSKEVLWRKSSSIINTYLNSNRSKQLECSIVPSKPISCPFIKARLNSVEVHGSLSIDISNRQIKVNRTPGYRNGGWLLFLERKSIWCLSTSHGHFLGSWRGLSFLTAFFLNWKLRKKVMP